jgi:hypothetical protein
MISITGIDDVALKHGIDLNLPGAIEQRLQSGGAIGRPALVTVVGTFEQDGALIEPFVTDSSFLASFGATRYEVSELTISLPDAASSAGEISRLDEAARNYPGIQVQDRSGYAAQSASRIDPIILVANGLLALTLFIALVGVATTPWPSPSPNAVGRSRCCAPSA